MKTLQNNFTTPEQSKRLLELGVPADSADCAMFPYDETFERYELRVVPFNRVFSTYEIYNEDGTIYPGKTPCWSVGKLIEIWNICANLMPGMDLEFSPSSNSYIEDLVRDFELAVEDSLIDFSKLED